MFKRLHKIRRMDHPHRRTAAPEPAAGRYAGPYTGLYTGRRLPRPDAVPLLRGLGRYVADIRPPGCLDAAFTRSYLAHAELRAVDVRAAAAAPGVVYAAAAGD